MSDDEDSGEEVDVSVVRKAIKISGNMVEQILKGIHYGSPEIRCLLYSECDYILECKVCRNLFRSLPNFVAHKRSYCKTAYQESETFFGELRADEQTVIVQPEAPEESAASKSKRSKPRNLESTIQLLKDGFLGNSTAYKVYSKAAEKMEAQKEQRKTQTLTLESIPSTTQAMKVTVADGLPKESEIADATSENRQTGLQSSPTATLKSMLLKTAMEEENNSTSNGSATNSVTNTQTDSKQTTTTEVNVANSRQPEFSPPKKMTLRCKEGINSMPWKKARKDNSNEPTSPEKGMDLKNLLCLDCNTSFRSRKTLIFHYQNAHCGKRTFYPCPYCDGVFFYIFGLTRHLMRNHNKSKAQVDKMRTKLKKSAFVKQVTEPCQSARQQILHVRDIEPQKAGGVTQKDAMNLSPENSKLKPGGTHQEVMQVNSGPQNSKIQQGGITQQDAPNPENSKMKPEGIAHQPNSGPQNSKMKPGLKKEPGDIIQTESSLNSPAKEGEHVCSNCHRAFGKKLSLLNHRRICLTQDCVMSSGHSTDNAAAVAKSHDEKCGSADSVKRPTVKMTKLIGRARFSARSTSQRIDYAKMANPVLPNMDDGNSGRISHGDQKGCKGRDRGQRVVQRQRNRTENTLTEPHSEGVKREVGTCMMTDEEDDDDEFISQKVRLVEDEFIGQKVRVVEEIWVDKQPGRPTEKVKSNRTYVMKSAANQKLECQDTKKVTAIVNESDLQCRHCDQAFSNVSNLRRHAIRHLGWKRYKCKMCKFSSYNKSECNTHLYRTHSDRFRNVSSVNSLIVDLGKEGSRARLRKKQQTLSERQALEDEDYQIATQRQNRRRAQNAEQSTSARKSSASESSPGSVGTRFNISTRGCSREFDNTSARKSSANEKSPREFDNTSAKKSSADDKTPENVGTRFNISTRNNPREFDTSPYEKTSGKETVTSLCTRKSSYPKKLILRSQTAYDSDEEDSVSNASGCSRNAKTDSMFLSYLSEISAKAKAEEEISATSDTGSETSKSSKVKGPRSTGGSLDSPVTRRSGRSVDSCKTSPAKSGVSSTTITKSGDDGGELKACKNLSNKLVE